MPSASCEAKPFAAPAPMVLDAEEFDRIKRETWDEGRVAAANCFPVVHQEGFDDGYQAALNAVYRTLRTRARDDPSVRGILIELLEL